MKRATISGAAVGDELPPIARGSCYLAAVGAAGIPRYWIVDLADPLSLVDCQLAAQFGYQDATAVTTAYTSTVTVRDGHTFTVTLALDRLL